MFSESAWLAGKRKGFPGQDLGELVAVAFLALLAGLPGSIGLVDGDAAPGVDGGAAEEGRLGGKEGGKTGTTNDGRDLLFIGYEPSRHWVLGIWLGNDDNSPTASSSALAAVLWGDIIRAAGRGSVTQ